MRQILISYVQLHLFSYDSSYLFDFLLDMFLSIYFIIQAKTEIFDKVRLQDFWTFKVDFTYFIKYEHLVQLILILLEVLVYP